MFGRYGYILLVMLVVGLSSCGETYNKILKSNNLDYKLTKAKEYYNNGKYDKAIPLFEELIPLYKGTVSINEIYYLYAMSHYEEASFIIACFHFKNIHDSYPLSPYAEECLYMTAFCDYKMSASVQLDQTYTTKAIDGFQLFINSYPNSDKITEANQMIEQLRRKLEIKALNAAELYLKMKLYKAAATSFSNILIDFPDTKDDEKVSFMVVKSYYLYAQNSIRAKQMERYEETVKAYKVFAKKYGGSTFMKEADKIYEATLKDMEDFKNYKDKKKRL